MSNYIHQHTGARFWDWRHGPGQNIRAGEARELSNYVAAGDSPIIRPGVPEPLTCFGSFGSSASMLTTIVALGALAWLAVAVIGVGKRVRAKYKTNPSRRKRRKARRRRTSARRRYQPTRRPVRGKIHFTWGAVSR